MRSRSGLDRAAVGLGAAAEGVWCGALTAVLTKSSWLSLAVFAWATVAAGAVVARRLDGRHGGESVGGEPARSERLSRRRAGGEGAAGGRQGGWSGGGERSTRVLAVTLVFTATGVLLVAGRSWAHPLLLWLAARDLVYCGGLVLLGIYLGRAPQAPEVAVRRAVRAFGLLCVILVIAAAAGPAPGWGPAAVVASLVVGGSLIAVVRWEAITELVDPADRLPAWPWLLAVMGTVLLVVALGALVSLVLRVDALLWALHLLGGVLRLGLDVAGFALGYAGAALLRAVGWVLGVFHIHAWHAKWTPPLAPKLRLGSPLRDSRSLKLPGADKLVATIVGAVLLIGALVALVVLGLRRIRREPAEAMVAEEREELDSLRSAAGKIAGRLGRRIRSRIQGLGRREPLSPGERVRRRYAELERRLAKAGRPRRPGVTVREYLAGVAADDVAAREVAKARADAAGDVPRPAAPKQAPPEAAAASPDSPPRPAATSPAPRSAADLAGIYELARYSTQVVDASQAQRFESLVRAFGA